MEDNSSKIVLIIEDDEHLRKFLKLILENKFNFIIHEAIDGKQGLESISKEKPYLIILDLMMPEISGKEFMEILRKKEETKDIPVIVCSSVADRNVIVELVRYKILDYILKPVNPSQLVVKISDYIKDQEDKQLVK